MAVSSHPTHEGATAADIARRYLALCEEGRVAEAADLVAPAASIVFPGGVEYAGPAEQVEHGRSHYRRVGKEIEREESWAAADGRGWCVIISGTLGGEALDGSAFDGIRFIDRFRVLDGRITEHHVWNDLAHRGVITPG
ncbi:nuclear transport factor 2 family protein [Pseudonocardia sp. N23]|uniref:nuclear transport factor 2 family protein n=1 Tax=Pseudonocardia sp. N23 TaxID=1987376 RepID=UPI000BFB8BE8|nr:nuclear transport factor 2 family protein [Pseudonocardia sp. N23]GAY08155.1 putative inner membrane protein [Pseudonocardia sp. N23]